MRPLARTALHSAGLCLLLAACQERAPKPVPTQDPRPQPAAVEHDFGVIPHGESRRHDYVLNIADLPDGPYVPLRAQLDCSCGRGELILRDRDGNERTLDGRPDSTNAPALGETLIARVIIDTLTKDPVDLPHAISRGYVVLQPTDDRTGLRRVSWPLLVRFGIDCPVTVSPFAALDFKAVPQSARPEFALTLAGDEAHPGVRFGPVLSSDPAIEANLESQDQRTVLRVRCQPGEVGNHRAVLAVATDLEPAYRLNIGVTWKVVPDLIASPMDKISFRARLDRPQTEAESSSQYLLVINHDEAKSPEFSVHRIVGDGDRDVSSCFAVTFEPAPGTPRLRRMFVRYRGGLAAAFRGTLVLTVDGDAGPFLPITLIVFPIDS